MQRVALGTGSTAICQRKPTYTHIGHVIAIETRTHLTSRAKANTSRKTSKVKEADVKCSAL
jgi:hypothetical protein